MDLFEKVDKIREDMDTEVKTSFKWVVFAAVFGLIVVLIFYILVVRAHAGSAGTASRDQYGSFQGVATNPNEVGPHQRQPDRLSERQLQREPRE
jgi:hypothetical protein